MVKPKAEPKTLKLEVTEMRTALARRIAAQAPSPGEHPDTHTRFGTLPPHGPHSLLPRYIRTKPERLCTGAKADIPRRDRVPGDGSSFLVSSIDVSVQSQIIEASGPGATAQAQRSLAFVETAAEVALPLGGRQTHRMQGVIPLVPVITARFPSFCPILK
jgi:hypothetical protein